MKTSCDMSLVVEHFTSTATVTACRVGGGWPLFQDCVYCVGGFLVKGARVIIVGVEIMVFEPT